MQAVAVSIMVLIDLPVCHKIAATSSLATSTLARGLISSAEWLGYHHPNHKFDKGQKLITEIPDHYIHKALEFGEDSHDEEEHRHTFLDSVKEVSTEITLGWLASLSLPNSWVKLSHNLDIMHVIPGWSALEETAPAISNGHGVAESLLYVLSTAGPFYDIFIQGYDPKEVQQFYWDNSPISTMANCYGDINQCKADALAYFGYGDAADNHHTHSAEL